jgi:hypothetical protein
MITVEAQRFCRFQVDQRLTSANLWLSCLSCHERVVSARIHTFNRPHIPLHGVRSGQNEDLWRTDYAALEKCPDNRFVLCIFDSSGLNCFVFCFWAISLFFFCCFVGLFANEPYSWWANWGVRRGSWRYALYAQVEIAIPEICRAFGGLILWGSKLGGSIYFLFRRWCCNATQPTWVGLSDSRVIELPRRSDSEIKTDHEHLTLTMGLTVAVAGATGRVGRTIVEQIQHENKFPVIGLTRSVSFVQTHIPNRMHYLTV